MELRPSKNLISSPGFDDSDQIDSFTDSQLSLARLLGICVIRCQEIEHLIANSFILGVSDPEKHKYETIREMIESWERKTLGQQLRTIKHSWLIDPELDATLTVFLDMRNRLVHGLTTSDRYNFQTLWGQKEMAGFLFYFEFISRSVRKVFRCAWCATAEYGNTKLLNGNDQKISLSKKDHELADLFFCLFQVKV